MRRDHAAGYSPAPRPTAVQIANRRGLLRALARLHLLDASLRQSALAVLRALDRREGRTA